MFDPSTIPWVIRVNAANAYKNTGLTTPAVADGDIVQGLKHLGTSSLDFNQASSASGPKLRLNKANGKACLYFDAGTPCTLGVGGAADSAGETILETLQGTDYTFYIVCRPMNVSSSSLHTILAKTNYYGYSPRIGFVFSNEGFGNASSISDGVVSNVKGQPGTTSYRLQALVDQYQASATTEKIYRRGILSCLTASNTLALDTSANHNNPMTIGGIAGGTGSPFEGEFYELFAIGRLLTDVERVHMDSYVAATYGVSNGLVLWSGNSMVYGSGAVLGTSDPVTLSLPYLGGDFAGINNGVGGERTTAMTTYDALLYTPSFGSAILQPLVHLGWEIYNDINDNSTPVNAPTAYANIKAWAVQSRGAGCKGVIVCSPMPGKGGSVETVRQAVRTLLAADFTIATEHPNVFLANIGGNGYADVYCDVGNDYFLGPAGANSSTTDYNADGIHPNATGNAILAPTFAYAIRLAARIAGNIPTGSRKAA